MIHSLTGRTRHNYQLCFLNNCESLVLSDVISSVTLTIKKNGHTSGLEFLLHRGQTRMMWKSDKEVGAMGEENKLS